MRVALRDSIEVEGHEKSQNENRHDDVEFVLAHHRASGREATATAASSFRPSPKACCSGVSTFVARELREARELGERQLRSIARAHALNVSTVLYCCI